MVEIKRQLVASRGRTSPGTNGRKYITIHETANTSKGANAQAHANLQTNGFSASWHYTVDDKEAIQSFPHAVRCWHSGDGTGAGNYASIGVEICVNSDGDFAQAVRNAAELVRKIMAEEGIPAANVVQHNRWSGKNCPTNLRNGAKGVNWADFMAMVKAPDKVTQVSAPVVAPKPAPKPVAAKPIVKPPAAKPPRTLKSGDSGADVKAMQQALASVYYYPEKGAKNNGVDGHFGPKTQAAVKRFQSVHTPAEVDGYFGPKTRAALDKATWK